MRARLLATGITFGTLLAVGGCGARAAQPETAGSPASDAVSPSKSALSSVSPSSSLLDQPATTRNPAAQPTASVSFVPDGLVLVHTATSPGLHGEPMTLYIYASSPKNSPELVVSLLVATPENRIETDPATSASVTNLRALDDSALPGAQVYDLDAKWTTVRWQPDASLWAAVGVSKTSNIDQLLAIAHSVTVN